jgi:Na+-transporting NADH:ubiquinone oxidoreductase subunit NqrD
VLLPGISIKKELTLDSHSSFQFHSRIISEGNLMKFSTLMSIKAVICLVFGVGEVLLPTTLMSFYGATLDAGGAFMAQLFGAAFILLGLLLWLMRNTTEASTVKAFSISLFLGDAVGFVIRY